jgi:nitrilase
VIGKAGHFPAVLQVEIDPRRLAEVRRLIPMSEHRVLLDGKHLHIKPERM